MSFLLNEIPYTISPIGTQSIVKAHRARVSLFGEVDKLKFVNGNIQDALQHIH